MEGIAPLGGEVGCSWALLLRSNILSMQYDLFLDYDDSHL